MNEMMTWESPKCAVQRFEANDHVAVCEDFENTYYRFSCNAFKRWNDYFADLWVYNDQTSDSPDWMSTWTGTKDNSNNLTPGAKSFTACGEDTEYLDADEVNSIQRGWFDANALDVWSLTSGDAESFKFNVWIWKDNSGGLHASTDVDIRTQTTIGDHSK